MSEFAKTVWETLSQIDCAGQVEQKGNLSYLSWANAWTELMNVYPESTFTFNDDVGVSGGTVEVSATVDVREGESVLTRTMTLPVMDFKNKAIENPSSRDISDSRMRCLVKCIALFGLGLFLYRGEDIPKPTISKQSATHNELASEEQKSEIKDFNEAGHMSPRRVTWCDTLGNWDRMTKGQAEQIIKESKQLEEEA